MGKEPSNHQRSFSDELLNLIPLKLLHKHTYIIRPSIVRDARAEKQLSLLMVEALLSLVFPPFLRLTCDDF